MTLGDVMSIFDFYNHEFGSKVWPSLDPEDSPFDKYICIACGKEFSIQMCGVLAIGESFFDKAEIILRKHLLTHCTEEFLLKVPESINSEALNVLIERHLLDRTKG